MISRYVKNNKLRCNPDFEFLLFSITITFSYQSFKEFIKSEGKSTKISAARASNPYQKKAYEKVLIIIPPPSKIFPVLKGGILIKGGILNINYPDNS